MNGIHNKINRQIYLAMEKLGADPELLSIIGSYGDSQSDADILEMLEQYNENGTCIAKTIFSVNDTPQDRRDRFEVVKK